jgi:hypothetical protein
VVTQAAKVDPKSATGRNQAVTTAAQAQKIALEKKPTLLERLFGGKK